ncbi:hypothetical protein [Novosphingobium sp. B1]|uniref:hypothetical protein n=1 Tax=Novosphingobium sp. B1 TaxID=1938756 RepID=UPI00111C25B5|nr:hypothetical protein [Novosphingobium sp. B1]
MRLLAVPLSPIDCRNMVNQGSSRLLFVLEMTGMVALLPDSFPPLQRQVSAQAAVQHAARERLNLVAGCR